MTWNRLLLSISLSILLIYRIAFAATFQRRETVLNRVTLEELENSVCKDYERPMANFRTGLYRIPRRLRMCCEPNLASSQSGENHFITGCIIYQRGESFCQNPAWFKCCEKYQRYQRNVDSKPNVNPYDEPEVVFGLDCFDARIDVVDQKQHEESKEKTEGQGSNTQGPTQEQGHQGETKSHLRHRKVTDKHRIVQPNSNLPGAAGSLAIPGVDAVRQYLKTRQ